MKLQKLTIHNIASIKDASIDFGSNPLAGADVFLISGKTGAGKSTILDCICLALFNDTPRLAHSEMQGNVTDFGKELNIRSPRQLLRRGTGEGFTTLTFTGNDGIDYEATWSVRRANKKPEGNIQASNWEIRNLSTGTVTVKIKENNAIIGSAIGMDFSQYCRTTMLAQGEFTRFLNSEDSDKAKILERITGETDYALIGARIYEIYSGKKTALDIERHKIDSIPILAPDEKTALTHRLEEIVEKKQIASARRSAVIAIKEWITERDNVETSIREASIASDNARKALETPEMTILRRTSEQLSVSAEARHALADLNASAQELETIEKEYGTFPSEFSRILARRDNIARQHTATASALYELEKSIEKEVINKEIYGSATLIRELAAQISRHKANKEEYDSTAETLRRKLDSQLMPALEDAGKKLETATEVLAKEKQRLADGEAALEAMGIPRLKSLHDTLTRQKAEATLALTEFQTWTKEKERHASLEKIIADDEKTIESKKAESEKSAGLATIMRERRDTLKEAYERQLDTVDKWAVAMRSHLHVGDTCPVCMQTVASMPPAELINRLVNDSKEAFNKAEKEHEELRNRINALNADIKALSDNLVNNRQQASDTSLLDNSAEHVTAFLSSAMLTADSATDADTATLIRQYLADTEQKLHETDTLLEQAGKSEMEVASQRKKVAEYQTVIESLRKRHEKAKADVTANLNAQENARNLSRLAKETIGSNIRRIKDTIAGTLYDGRSSNLDALCDEIQSKAIEYNDNIERRNSTAEKLNLLTSIIENIDSGIYSLRLALPSLEETVADTSVTDTENPSEAIANLRSRIKSADDRHKNAQQRRKASETSVKAFLESHPDITRQRLEELAALKDADIERISSEVRKACERASECLTLLRKFESQRVSILNRSPEGAGNMTAESVTETIATLDRNIDEFNQTAGSLKQRFMENDANLEKIAGQEKIIRQLEADIAPWEKLNLLVGDSTGSKFRKIAQSYILAALVDSANHYMATLTDRYRLTVKPGSFIVSIEDAYQGYATRATSTISGGESFIVSLALALALSDIGDRVSSNTIFIDEGFGTLSGEYLHKAIETLRKLRSGTGRHVGIISHVEELREKIPVQIVVERESNESFGTIRVSG